MRLNYSSVGLQAEEQDESGTESRVSLSIGGYHFNSRVSPSAARGAEMDTDVLKWTKDQGH